MSEFKSIGKVSVALIASGSTFEGPFAIAGGFKMNTGYQNHIMQYQDKTKKTLQPSLTTKRRRDYYYTGRRGPAKVSKPVSKPKVSELEAQLSKPKVSKSTEEKTATRPQVGYSMPPPSQPKRKLLANQNDGLQNEVYKGSDSEEDDQVQGKSSEEEEKWEVQSLQGWESEQAQSEKSQFFGFSDGVNEETKKYRYRVTVRDSDGLVSPDEPEYHSTEYFVGAHFYKLELAWKGKYTLKPTGKPGKHCHCDFCVDWVVPDARGQTCGGKRCGRFFVCAILPRVLLIGWVLLLVAHELYVYLVGQRDYCGWFVDLWANWVLVWVFAIVFYVVLSACNSICSCYNLDYFTKRRREAFLHKLNGLNSK